MWLEIRGLKQKLMIEKAKRIWSYDLLLTYLTPNYDGNDQINK